ncbi:hypothetical protein ATPR_3104 [Acetobacter tropicalis NBRC 101654]|uniref:Uncharacterized protein n=1 Tax=Acetobacter tropicalis NBRC 101654 TaxID=749388 RepID=F7VIA5_9PROT|nr:hypothetical protein ATPR_3104 [Acetobacter tropicalis NBRC 101654]
MLRVAGCKTGADFSAWFLHSVVGVISTTACENSQSDA